MCTRAAKQTRLTRPGPRPPVPALWACGGSRDAAWPSTPGSCGPPLWPWPSARSVGPGTPATRRFPRPEQPPGTRGSAGPAYVPCRQDHLRARPQTTGGVHSGGAGGPSGAVTVISPASSLGASRTPSLNATGSCVCRLSFLCREVTVDPPGKTPACLTPFHTRLKCAAVPQAAVPP